MTPFCPQSRAAEPPTNRITGHELLRAWLLCRTSRVIQPRRACQQRVLRRWVLCLSTDVLQSSYPSLSAGVWVISRVWLLRIQLSAILPPSLGEEAFSNSLDPQPPVRRSTQEDKGGQSAVHADHKDRTRVRDGHPHYVVSSNSE